MTDPAALLVELCRFRTDQPAADERPLARHLAQALRARGADEVTLVEVPRPGAHGAYAFARWGRPRLLLNAHLDTVPPNDGWHGDPFEPRLDGTTVRALGACDTKGGIAAILAALDAERPRDLGVLFSGDEEHGSTCVKAFLGGPDAAGIERAIVFEPTSCRVGTRHRGIIAVSARLVGQGGHSSRADTLPAPLAELGRLAAAWSDWGRARAAAGPPGFPGMCLNIARLDGGVAFNVVPEEATLLASVRPPPGADCRAVGDELGAIAARVVPGAQVTFPVADHEPFQTRDLGAFAAAGFRPAGDAATPGAGPIDLAYWTEAALLAAAGIDAVVYGPGDIAQAHAPDEWVPIADLLRVRDEVSALLRATRGA